MTALIVVSADAKEHRVVEGSSDTIPELDCVIEPSEIVDVGSAVSGVVEAILADRSDLVEKGGIIVQLESSVEQVTLELTKMRAKLNTAIELRQESATFGHLTQKRNQELLQKSAISMQDMDQLKTETRIAELQVRQEIDNKRIAALEYHRARAILQQRTILSPVKGVVMDRFKSVGEYVEDEPVLRVAQLDPLHVEVIVPVEYLGRIVTGMQAEVTSGLAGLGTHLATVERVDRVADAASGTYGVRLSLSNPDYKIPAGMRCRLGFLPLEEKEVEEIAGGTGVSPVQDQGSGTSMREELEPAPKPESITRDAVLETPVAESPEQPGACYTIGPVADEARVQQLSVGLEVLSTGLAMRHETVSQGNRYLVLAVPNKDHQTKKILQARLQAAGITDRYVLLRGKYKGRVSLGLYSKQKTAHGRQQHLADKGFETQIKPIPQQTTQYWLDLALKAGKKLPQRVQEISDTLPPSVSIEPVNCYYLIANR